MPITDKDIKYIRKTLEEWGEEERYIIAEIERLKKLKGYVPVNENKEGIK